MTSVCPHCFEEKELRRRIEEIRPRTSLGRCSFHPRYKGVPIEYVAEIIDEVFRSTHSIASFNPHSHEYYGEDLHSSLSTLSRPTSDAVMDAVIDQLLQHDAMQSRDGNEPFYERDQYYAEAEPDSYNQNDLWDAFRESVTYAQRFFNNTAKDLIAELFDEIQYQRDNEKNSPVYLISPDDPESLFFRARKIDDNDERTKVRASPAEKLGPPPKRLRTPGRMNAAGVSAFYGATTIDTCIAELRPPVGSHVMCAAFRLVRPVLVLDTTRFVSPIRPMSHFSKKYQKRIRQWTFMKTFMDEIAKPILPTDEYLEYIPTQAVAEYLHHHHIVKHKSTDVRIEGIIYKSAQNPEGRNVVLLGEAAKIQYGTEKQTERTPKTHHTTDTFEEFIGTLQMDDEGRPGLAIVPNSVKDFRIGGAAYRSEETWPDDDIEHVSF